MPEIPDIEAYIEALRSRVVGGRLLGVRLASPFLLRTVEPPLQALENGTVDSVERLAKRIVFEVSPAAERGRPAPAEPLFVVLHLMIAGRLHWKVAGAPVPKGAGLVAFDFEDGCLIVTEAGKKRRASLRVVRGREELAALDPGGLEVAGSTMAGFAEMLRRENHTLKRALTDPHIVSGIGNAYSDEMRRLHEAATAVLSEWTERLRTEARQTFPEK
ncbi:MAG: formamidopyrimidine-DNA glycosylase, partial [Actinobacteria bacterium]|nr:formamidopyrimidine-DNA glycosylase [Actinomycetota bacterium]